MQNFQVAFAQNRRIALRHTSNENLKKEECVRTLLRNRRYYQAKRTIYESLKFYVLRSGCYRQNFRAKEDWGWHTWESKTCDIAYELAFSGFLPTEEVLNSLFISLVNPSGERRGHIHWVGYDGYIFTAHSTLILVGNEHINND